MKHVAIKKKSCHVNRNLRSIIFTLFHC